MRFKRGDLCVAVNANGSLTPDAINLNVTVLSLEHRDAKGFEFYSVEERPGWWFADNELRLRRPPSWDKWIFDTSAVKDETPSKAEIVNDALLRLGRPA